MEYPQLHPKEDDRLVALHQLAILDTAPEPKYDRLVEMVRQRFHISLAGISLLDKDREWFKSCSGTFCMVEGPRNISFCGHALLARDIFIVEDTLLDDRFRDNPMVVNSPFVRFYAGHALREQYTGLPVGVLCMKDTMPRKLSVEDIADFIEFARIAESLLNDD